MKVLRGFQAEPMTIPAHRGEHDRSRAGWEVSARGWSRANGNPGANSLFCPRRSLGPAENQSFTLALLTGWVGILPD